MKTLCVGIGCRSNSSAEQISAAVRAALGCRAFEAIGIVATVDARAHEAGLLEFCARHALPLKIFSREQIAALPLALAWPSAAAREHLGVDGVCEPCALLGAAAGARLIVRKTILDGVTAAIASPALAGIETTHHDFTRQDLP